MLVAEIVSLLSIPSESGSGSEKDKDEDRSTEDLKKELDGLLSELEAEEEAEGSSTFKPTPHPASSGRGRMKRLDFGKEMWEGKGQGKEECRRLRGFVGLRDGRAGVEMERLGEKGWMIGWGPDEGSAVGKEESSRLEGNPAQRHVRGRTSEKTTGSSQVKPTKEPKSKSKSKPKPQAKIDSDDDSLIGYSSSSSSPSSSRSPSPTPSYLESIALDPSLHSSTRPKVSRPVYITQLVDLLRAREEPDKLEMGLKWGESLIRRKRDFGREVEENSIALGIQLLALNDNFNLEEFEERRQGMLIALTAGCPRTIPPFLAQQYFEGDYSLLQRTAILASLAMGARELAEFKTIQPARLATVNFPSKVLKGKVHGMFLTEGDSKRAGLLEVTAGEVMKSVLSEAKDGSEGMVAKELVRTRRLRVSGGNSKGKIQEVSTTGGTGNHNEEETNLKLTRRSDSSLPKPIVSFSAVAGEYFILPMINRFWLHFQDESARLTRTRNNSTRGGAGLGGTGMILSPLAMGKYLSTLSIMIHAARYSNLFLSVIAPEGLELAVTVGSRLSQISTDSNSFVSVGTNGADIEEVEFESDVVGAALELALVCLSTSKDLDNGRTLALDKGTILMAAGEWASLIFESERKGENVAVNGGGEKEGRTRKAAAGVVVVVAGIAESMQGGLR